MTLLPCPFCGSDADLREDDKHYDGLHEEWVVGCTSCPAEFRGTRERDPCKNFPDQKERVIALWNRREFTAKHTDRALASGL